MVFLFKNVNCFFICYFLELDLEIILDEMIENYKPVFDSLHENYRRRLWNGFLDNIILNYMKSFFESCKKGKHAYLQ